LIIIDNQNMLLRHSTSFGKPGGYRL
jgi:hypothetical protein